MVLLLLVAGAIVNVAVAWGCALWSRTHGYTENTYTHESGPRWHIAMGYGFGVTRVVYVPDNTLWNKTGRETVNPTAAPYWSCTYVRPQPEVVEDTAKPWSIEIGFGWPLRSGYTELKHYSSQHPGQSHPVGVFYPLTGIQVRGLESSSMVPFRVLPVLPIWPGFAVNALLYAAILWLMFAAPLALWRRRRIKRGLCPKCAYPVGTWGAERCTECGATHAVKPPPAPSTT